MISHNAEQTDRDCLPHLVIHNTEWFLRHKLIQIKKQELIVILNKLTNLQTRFLPSMLQFPNALLLYMMIPASALAIRRLTLYELAHLADVEGFL